MGKKSLRVLYMGTPEFAVAPLDGIMKSGHEVIGVVTTPDKPAGRGQKLTESAVKKYALKYKLPLFQPQKMKDPEFLAQIQKLNPDVIVVVAFRLLPREIWAMPPIGTFNLHASLLPRYRGASPINFAIINGDKESGVTTFFIDDKIDTGEILLQAKTEIHENDDAGSLHDKLQEIGKELVVKTLDGLAENSLKSEKQVIEDGTEYKYAPKIFKEDCLINWNAPLEKIHNLIRGLSPYPAAFTRLVTNEQSRILKIYKGNYKEEKHILSIGTVLIEGKKTLKIAGKDGFYFPKEVQPEGKKRMEITDFINGLIEKQNLRVE
ncbi:MAG: methionyl-tRNA formyltransferase [Flavobacteriaceae bacterium]|jgi:methionyl-tRNA formyltransferase|nr:methionyl-tRNA formyltransferase [Flavobacteriaceae bacterium]